MTTTTPAEPSDATKRLLPWLVAVAFFMQSLDTTILNTAVPAISQAMDVTPLNVKSVLASYTLSLAVFIPVSGWMADRFGTRTVFAAAIALFTLGSVLCGLATNIDMLVACRILQGAGGDGQYFSNTGSKHYPSEQAGPQLMQGREIDLRHIGA